MKTMAKKDLPDDVRKFFSNAGKRGWKTRKNVTLRDDRGRFSGIDKKKKDAR